MLVRLKNFYFSNLTQRGFSLVELILIIMLVGLTTVSMLSQWDLRDARVQTAMLKVTKDIRYAQNRAMVTGELHGFRTVSGSQYEIYQQAPGSPVQDPSTGLDMLVDLALAYGDVIFQGTYQVEFNELGAPTLGGGASMSLALGEINRTFTIEDNTGRVNLPF